MLNTLLSSHDGHQQRHKDMVCSRGLSIMTDISDGDKQYVARVIAIDKGYPAWRLCVQLQIQLYCGCQLYWLSKLGCKQCRIYHCA